MSLGRAYIEIIGDVSKFAPDLRRGLTKALKLASVTGVAASASTNLIGLAGALSQVGGAAVAIPAGIALVVAAVGALRLATAGLSEAFAAAAGGDAAAFEKSLQNLSPLAQQLARELRTVQPELAAIRTSTQDAFAAPLVGQIATTAALLAGPLRSGLAGVAAEYGRVARRALEFVRESATVSTVTAVLDTTRLAVAGVTGAVGPLLRGFRDLTVLALPTLSQLAALAGPLAAQFGTWLSAMATSGAAAAALQGALEVLRQFGQVALNVGGIVRSVLQAAAQAGGGDLLSTLVRLTAQLNAFFASAEGQQALIGLFGVLSTLAAGLGPILVTLLKIIGGSIVPAVGGLAQAVVAAVQSLATGLGPAIAALAPVAAELLTAVVNGIQALGPVLGPVGQAIASVLAAVTPVLPVLGQLIAMLIGPLATALGALGPLIGPLATALGPVLLQLGRTLTDSLAPIVEVLRQLFVALGPPIGQLVAALGASLAPVLSATAPVITAIVQALLPLIPTFVQLLGPITDVVIALAPLNALIAQILVLAAQLVAPLIKLAAVLLQLLVSKAVAPLISAIAGALTWLLNPLAGAAQWVGRLATALGSINWAQVGAAIGGAFAAAWQTVTGFLSSLGRFLAGLPGMFVSALAALPGLFVTLLEAAFGAALTAVGVGIGLVIFAVTQLPGRVLAGLASLVGLVGNLFTRAWANAGTVTRNGTNALTSFVSALPGRASSALGRLPGVLAGLLTNAWNAARRSASSGINALVSAVGNVPNRLGSLAGRFVTAGSNLIAGFMRGFRRVGSLGDIASSITAAVRNGLNRVIGRINSGIADIDQYLPGTLPRIPYLANGGIIDAATLAVLGEAGREVVIPLTRPKRARELAEQSGLLALLGAGEGTPVMFGPGAVQVTFEGVVPTQAEAVRTGRAVGEGIRDTLARRDVRARVRTI